jgi:hypothetical protein
VSVGVCAICLRVLGGWVRCVGHLCHSVIVCSCSRSLFREVNIMYLQVRMVPYQPLAEVLLLENVVAGYEYLLG